MCGGDCEEKEIRDCEGRTASFESQKGVDSLCVAWHDPSMASTTYCTASPTPTPTVLNDNDNQKLITSGEFKAKHEMLISEWLST
jgi:hypothetical protein